MDLGDAGREALPTRDDHGRPRAGHAPLDVSGFRPRSRQPALLGAIRDDGRPCARDLDLAAEPEQAGPADATVRFLQPGRGSRRSSDPLVGSALALSRVRLQASVAHRRTLRRAEAPGRIDDPGLADRLRRTGTVLRPLRMGSRRLRDRREPEGPDSTRREPVRGPSQSWVPEPTTDDQPLRRHVRVGLPGARAPSLPSAGRDHLARLYGSLRESPFGVPLLRLLHPFRLRGRREDEPAEHAPTCCAELGELRRATRLQGHEDRDRRRRARDGCHLRGRQGNGALPTGRRGRRLRIHAREQPAPPPLAVEGSTRTG